jgi:hypothetical protein
MAKGTLKVRSNGSQVKVYKRSKPTLEQDGMEADELDATAAEILADLELTGELSEGDFCEDWPNDDVA